MKEKLKIFCVIALFIVLPGCWWTVNQGFTSIYVIKNETSYEIEICGFDKNKTLSGVLGTADTIRLSPLSEQRFVREGGEGNDSRTFFSIPYVDSVRIHFIDHDKILILSCDIISADQDCHPIIWGKMEVAITEEDYNNAVPIEE